MLPSCFLYIPPIHPLLLEFTMTTPYQSIFRSDLFKGQTIVVTGGGSGIGRCTAHELSSLGAHVVIVGRNSDKLEQVVQEIKQQNGSVTALSCDIRQETAVIELIHQIQLEHGVIHGLVNNAGGQYMMPLSQISAKGFDAVVQTNLNGGFLMMRECFLQSMQHHGGSIVNIVADMWGSMPGMGHSGAARAGMVNLTETAALEWAQFGVRVNAVAPGYIASSGMDHYPQEAGPMLRKMAQTVPLGRFGTESETSAGIVFLLSPAASFISGSTLRIDGARPQVRMGWGEFIASQERQQRSAIQPFNGFHLASQPKVFQDISNLD